MVRFKVIKGSHLLLAVAVIILVVVIGLILLQGNRDLKSPADPYASTAELAQSQTAQEAKALSAFASQALSPGSLKIEIIKDSPIAMDESKAANILIYHTHTHEAYEQDESDPYKAIETWRTLDKQHSVVRLGSVLAEALEGLGYNVTHDTTDHEQDSLSDAYVRSLQTLESYQNAGTEFDLCIDLHRDAWVEGLPECISIGDTEYAPLMLLVGRGDAYSGDEKPDYDGNLAFAQRLTAAINELAPGLCRNVTVKQGRYNQHIGARSILVEVGHNLNTLDQALASVPVLAKALQKTMSRFQ